MPSLKVVSVFYLEQDTSWEKPREIVSREEARSMKLAGLGRFVDHGRNFRLFEGVPIVERLLVEDPKEYKSSEEFTCAITVDEMLANVGIYADSLKDPRGRVARARHKIRIYPHVFDDLATLARGRAPGRP